MTYLSCKTNLKGAGSLCGNITPITEPMTVLLLRPGFTFTNSEACDTLADINTAIANKDIFVIGNVINFEDQKVENGVYTGSAGNIVKGFEGIKGGLMRVQASLDQHKILRTYSQRKWDMALLDRNNHIICIKNSDDTIGGAALSYFDVMQQIQPVGGEAALTPIQFQYKDAQIWDANGFYFEPAFRVSTVEPITHVTITVSTVDTNVFTLTASFVPGSTSDTDGTSLSIPLTGMSSDGSDIEVIDQTGAVNVIASMTESSTVPGQYVVTGTTLTSGTVKVKPNSDSLYESDSATLTAA